MKVDWSVIGMALFVLCVTCFASWGAGMEAGKMAGINYAVTYGLSASKAGQRQLQEVYEAGVDDDDPDLAIGFQTSIETSSTSTGGK